MIKPINTAISGIRRAGNTALEYGVKKPLKALSKAGFMDDICEAYQKDKMNIITGIGVGSIVLKDGYGCYLYVKQSLHNDKIPADKRKFVAALDLTNGGLMILTQLAMFFTISRPAIQKKMFKALFGKHFSRGAKKSNMGILSHQDKNFGKVSGKKFHTAYNQIEKDMSGVFGHLVGLAASTIIAKRVIVPFIATPLADKAKAWMCRNDKPETIHKDTKNTYNTYIPAVKLTDKATQTSSKLLNKFKIKKEEIPAEKAGLNEINIPDTQTSQPVQAA